MLEKLQIRQNHGSLKLKANAWRNKTSYKQNECLVKKGECLQRTHTKLQRKNRKHIRKTSTMIEQEDDKPIHASRGVDVNNNNTQFFNFKKNITTSA